MKNRLWILLGCVACALVLQAEPVPQFQDGDRVCFVGDSITHAAAYHSYYVYLYYLTRFPDREIQVWNKGVGGNQADSVILRFDTDIASAKPTVSTIMLGMNDVGRHLYGVDKTDAASLREHERLLDQYAENMQILLDKFDAIGSKVILITPSIYDQTADIAKENNFGVNDALGKCADFVRSTASERGYGLIDFYGPMLRINTELQKKDPSATIVGPDRVHPQAEFGHFIMAYEFLKAQQVPQLVSKMVLDADDGTVVEIENVSISDLDCQSSALSFTATEFALPFPQTDDIQKALDMVPFEEEMNQEILAVKNLPAGEYVLSIDDVEVGSWLAARLSAGINLADNRNTPQYKQALRVKDLNGKRNALHSKLRSMAFSFYGSGLFSSDIDLNDQEAVEAFLAEKLKKHEGKSYYDYIKRTYDEYMKLRPQEKQFCEGIEALQVKLYQANKPVPHKFSLVARTSQ